MSGGINTGYDMWEDHKNHYGVITARIMCLRYLDMQANKKDPEEREFCRELREAMAMERNYTDRVFYPHSYEIARANGEVALYEESENINIWCAGEIDDAIRACEYGDGSHKLAPAAQALLDQFGEKRLGFVLALEVRRYRDSFSAENRAWSDGFDIQSGFTGTNINARTEIIDELITCYRETLDRIRVEGLTLPDKENPYVHGTEYWRDLKQTSVSLDAALFTGGKYFDAMMGHACSESEMQFCRELFGAMYEETAGKTDPAKLVYSYGYTKSNERGETSFYNDSRRLNTLCACAIDDAIHDCRYRPNLYNFDLAAMKVVHEYGFHRVRTVLAKNLQALERNDKNKNIKWALGIAVPENSFNGAIIKSHRTFLEYFTTSTRKLYDEVNADRFILPGLPESGETVHGYEILRAIHFDDQRGFALGIKPNAAEQAFAVWQFTTESGARDFYWEANFDDFTEAAANYTARIIVHMNGYETVEVQKPPAAAEAPELNESEQNIAAWMTVTESSRFKWVEDEIYRLNGRGAMYYTGGEDGVYMRISKDGTLEVGNYEGAIPHIGEAMFTIAVTKQFDSFSNACKAAMEAGGKQFMVDMFSGSVPQPLYGTIRGAAKKQSVLKQIRDAQKTPQPPHKPTEPGQRKNKNDIEH